MGTMNIGWSVCCGSERRVADGRLRCPARGRSERGIAVRAQDCLDCRHLITSPVDRQPEGMCEAQT